MEAEAKFKLWYNKTPQKARDELIFYVEKDPYSIKEPFSLRVAYHEIRNKTEVSRSMLEVLGFQTD